MPEQPTGERLSVLLVEDNPGDARLITELVKEARVPPALAHVDALEKAFEALDGEAFDCVLLDLNLPGTSGIETLEAFRKRSADVPVVVLTGLRDEALGFQALRLGAQDYFVKGQVSGELLARAVRYAVERRHIEQELNESRFFSERVADAVPFALYVYDAKDSRTLYINRRGPELLGYTVERIADVPTEERDGLIHPVDLPKVFAARRSAAKAREGKFVDYEYRIRNARGQWRWFRNRDTVFKRDDDGNATQIIGTAWDITDQRRAKNALRESEERFRGVLENMRDAAYRFSFTKDAYEYFSPSAARLFGYTPSALLARGLGGIVELLHPEDRPLLESEYRRLLAGMDGPQVIEYRMMHSSGSYRWFSDSREVVKDRHGKIVAVVGNVRDVTDLKQAEETLRASEQRYRSFVELSPDVTYRLHPDGTFAFVSRAVEQFGYTSEELVGQPVDVIVAREEAASLRHFLAERRTGDRATRNVEFALRAKTPPAAGGNQVVAELSARGLWSVDDLEITSPQKGFVGTQGILRDVTGRKEAREKLRTYAARLEALRDVDEAMLSARSIEEIATSALNHLPRLMTCRRASLVEFDGEGADALILAVYDTDPSPSLTAGQRVPMDSFGSRESLARGEAHIVQDIKRIDAVSRVDAALLREGVRSYLLLPLVSGEAVMGTLNIGWAEPGGATVEHQAVAAELADILAVAIDRARLYDAVRSQAAVLERRVEERTRELANINRELESFSYSISHDLRTPLRAITGYCGMIEADHIDSLDAEARRMLGVIHESAGYMDALIRDLLEFSRVNRRALRCSRLDMAGLVDAALKRINAATEAHRHEIHVGALPAAHGDPILFQQVFANLLGNAIKFTSTQESPRIEVDGKEEGDEVVFWVRDNGVGFKPEQAHKLFTVFQRLHRSDEFEGTGAGLAIVQRIIHRHDGRIWAESEPGKGACFWFALPAVTEDESIGDKGEDS